MRLAAASLLCLLTACLVIMAQGGPIRDCKKIIFCDDTRTGGNGMCSTVIEYTRCSTNSRTIIITPCNSCDPDGCECKCSGVSPNISGFSIAYEDCQEVVHIDTYICKGCPTPTPTPQQACTTPGFDGSCPDGTYPDGAGMCCADGSCGGVEGLAAEPPASGDEPATSLAPGGGDGGCGCDDSARRECLANRGSWVESNCTCLSPVVVDVLGDGFALTSGAGGVLFDITADGLPEQIAWTAAGSDDAWLAFDRDGDGRVTSGAELFGNFTPQPAPPAGEQRNGFRALAVYDRAGNGGNGDGAIDARDAVYSGLRLWRDANHDGRSQPAELFTLPALDVVRVHLGYKESKRADEHGNRFLYRAKLDDARGAKVNRWAWDVFLTRGQ